MFVIYARKNLVMIMTMELHPIKNMTKGKVIVATQKI